MSLIPIFSMHSVAFFEVFQEEKLALKRHLPKNIRVFFTSQTIQSSGLKKPPAPLISIRTQSKIPAAWVPQIKGILTRSSGHDHLCRFRREIPSGYLPNYCARAVAEQAILLMLALLRRLPQQMKKIETFNRDGMTGQEALGKNLLVVGVGHIGSQVVSIGQGLQMNVHGVDLIKRGKGLKYTSLDRGLKWADIVICCLPLTKKTRAMLNYRNLKGARKGLILINIARGEITPLADIERLLREGILSGLGLDVYENESEVAEDIRTGRRSRDAQRLGQMKKDYNVVFTPHNAFNTAEAVERKTRESAAAVKYFLRNSHFPDEVPRR